MYISYILWFIRILITHQIYNRVLTKVRNAVITGWDPDEASTDGINPNVLISLMAPKRCALRFAGTHLLAGRFLPYDIQKKYELNLPKFPNTACITELH